MMESSEHLTAGAARRWRHLVALPVLLSLLVGGCASLEPYDYVEEPSPPPSGDAFWQQLAEQRDDDWFMLLNDGRAGLEWRVRAIRAATERIDLQTFIWEFDTVGALIRNELVAAADRGVEVRVLVDDSFLVHGNRAWEVLDLHPAIEIKVFNPFRRQHSSVLMKQILNLGEFHRLDHRMHNKSMVIDARAVVIGGRNLADEYFGFDQLGNFRDLEVLGFGQVAVQLAAGFDLYWNNPWSYPITEIPGLEVEAESTPAPDTTAADVVDTILVEQQPVQAWRLMAERALDGEARLLLDQPPRQRPGDADEQPIQVREGLLALIGNAETDVWLVSPYLIPTETLERAIADAHDRGVRVRILTNSIRSNDVHTAHAAYRTHLRRLVESGAEVHELRADAEDRDRYIESPHEHKALLLHAKLLIIDHDLAYVGSANLDPRSMRINTEMGLVIESESMNARLRRALEPDFAERNAWRIDQRWDGQLVWSAGEIRQNHPPDASALLRLEDWFLSLLPIESEL